MNASMSAMVKRLFGRGSTGERPKALPRATVEHDGVDKMVFGNFADDSPRFRQRAVENKPQIPPNVPDPDPIDFTSASPEDIVEWQGKANAAREARTKAPDYDAWEDLTRDVFYSYHHSSVPDVADPSAVDPSVSHHAKIATKMMVQDQHAQARNMTRDNPTAAGMATLGAIQALKGLLEEELVEQARESEEFEQQRDKAQNAEGTLEDLRQQGREMTADGQPVPQELIDQVKQAIQDKRTAQQAAAQIASDMPAPFSKDAHDVIVEAVKAGHKAAEDAGSMPSFGSSLDNSGEPQYQSPEQALTIADMWANNEMLKAVSELFGRISKDMMFQRAKRVTGGQDEIVDLKFGDELRRVLPSELMLLSDEDYEDEFYFRYANAELMIYSTVGEEHAGRGPMILVVDESGSMSGERIVWAKALALAILNIARREKRDFAYVGFSGQTNTVTFDFPHKKPMDAQLLVDMASHFFGGGTVPLGGLHRATEMMQSAEFKKADLVIIGDGDGSFGPEDKKLKDVLVGRGVRLHGIGIGGNWRYLTDYCDENVVNIHDFDLTDPSEATSHLATHMT